MNILFLIVLSLSIHGYMQSEDRADFAKVQQQINANKKVSCERCDLSDNALPRSTNKSASIGYKEAYLPNANLRFARANGLDFSDANLSNANLAGEKTDQKVVRRGEFDDTNFQRVKAQGATMSYGSFVGADFSHAQLMGANFPDANLESAKFSHADLTSVDFRRANMTRTNLTGANCSQANFEGANLTDATVDGANFTGANLNNAIWIDGSRCTDVTCSGKQLSKIEAVAHPKTAAKTKKIKKIKKKVKKVTALKPTEPVAQPVVVPVPVVPEELQLPQAPIAPQQLPEIKVVEPSVPQAPVAPQELPSYVPKPAPEPVAPQAPALEIPGSSTVPAAPTAPTDIPSALPSPTVKPVNPAKPVKRPIEKSKPSMPSASELQQRRTGLKPVTEKEPVIVQQPTKELSPLEAAMRARRGSLESEEDDNNEEALGNEPETTIPAAPTAPVVRVQPEKSPTKPIRPTVPQEGRSSLLSEIERGKQLRHVETEKRQEKQRELSPAEKAALAHQKNVEQKAVADTWDTDAD